jgi:hypothetical protein
MTDIQYIFLKQRLGFSLILKLLTLYHNQQRVNNVCPFGFDERRSRRNTLAAVGKKLPRCTRCGIEEDAAKADLLKSIQLEYNGAL